MLEYQGQYGKAKVMIDSIDSETVKQIYEFLNHEAFMNPIAIMPDTHAGKGAVIGFTMELTDKVIPNVIGVDIGCGMFSQEYSHNLLDRFDLSDLDMKIRNSIPFGTNVHEKLHINWNDDYFWKEVNYGINTMGYYLHKRFPDLKLKFPKEVGNKWLAKKCEDIGMDFDRVLKSCGTLGGGNHFIEIGKSINTNNIWITVHSGSRQFGLKIANYHQKKAGKSTLSYLEGQDMADYLVDMLVSQEYARENRKMMGYRIHIILGQPQAISRIESVHNYINFKDFIIRKGAISSYENEYMIIPFSMEDGILICKGKSNTEWNYSAPHGAGRVGSRRWAKENLSEEDAKERMKEKGIFCSKLPVDESAGAYKDPKIIEQAIEPTAEVIDRIKPILAMKD